MLDYQSLVRINIYDRSELARVSMRTMPMRDYGQLQRGHKDWRELYVYAGDKHKMKHLSALVNLVLHNNKML